MIPSATPFKEFYVDHHQIQVLDTPGYQGTDLQASGLFVGAHRRERIRAVLQTRPRNSCRLSPYFITQAIDWELSENSALQMQRLLDWPMRFVPVVEKGKFARVVDKNALTEQVARLFVREQVSRALSTIR